MAEPIISEDGCEYVSLEYYSKSPDEYILRGWREHPVVVLNAAGKVKMVIGTHKRTPEEMEKDHQAYKVELKAMIEELKADPDSDEEFDGSYFM